jgi:hypothetical protein
VSTTDSLFSIDAQIAIAKEAILAFCKDTKNPLDERIKVFSSTPGNLTTHCSWTITLKLFDRKHRPIEWYDDFGIDRYQTVNLRRFIESKDEHYGTAEWSDEKFKDFQEAVLACGYHSFSNDW